MNTSEQELKHIELSRLIKARKGAMESIELSKAYKRLRETPDFKVVFDINYFDKEIVRTTLLLSDKHMLKEEHRRSLEDALVSQSTLYSWLEHLETADLFMTNEMNRFNDAIKAVENELSNSPKTIEDVSSGNTTPPEGE